MTSLWYGLLAHERTTPDLVPVVRGTMHYKGGGGNFHLTGEVQIFSRGMYWCATKELTGLLSLKLGGIPVFLVIHGIYLIPVSRY